MKRLFLTIFCILATFVLGYTAYAATLKKAEKKELSKDPKDVQERILKSRINFLQNFSSTTLPLLPEADALVLRDEIRQISSLDSKSTNKSTSSTHSINETQVLLTSKIGFLNTYINYLKRPQQNTKVKSKNISKTISDELVHRIVNATSTRAIQEIQQDFVNSTIPKSKKIESIKNKKKLTNFHPAVQPPRLGSKAKVATTTAQVITPVVEEVVTIATSTATTTISEPEATVSTSTATTTPTTEEVTTSSSTETQ